VNKKTLASYVICPFYECCESGIIFTTLYSS
jgi:hypothetical protein